ncbi:G_PROTEIN_RECEP_F1_2 domain-containing protein [Meloidogyne graminicola]|uniref:G_PROTEIN_RECEP_F1_2 domain-containing protein n=1 Tax=Meloidogyne graminicola TaxID=189291 RepID=A0A8S9ZR45_9BILA|nr:G_PROTEIN_RECEP_F1_2 domain-containing protein [Meloidogyne graminicola]
MNRFQSRNNGINGTNATTSVNQRTDRTTRMLLAIVCVFLFTELPQGIIAVMSGMFSEEFRSHIYNNLGDILDLLSLCNALASFVIYCTMSAQFRNEFRRVFLPTTQRVKCWRELFILTRRRNVNKNTKEMKQKESFCCDESYGQVEERKQSRTNSPLIRPSIIMNNFLVVCRRQLKEEKTTQSFEVFQCRATPISIDPRQIICEKCRHSKQVVK